MSITNFSAVSASADAPVLLDINNSRSFVGSNQADIVFNHAIIDFIDLTPHPTDRGYPTTDITNWTLAGDQLTFYTGTAVAAQFAFHDQSPEAAGGSHIHIGRVAGNTGLYLTEGTSYGPGGGDTIPGTITNAPVTPPATQPVPQQPAPPATAPIAAADGTTGLSVALPWQAYTGPVPGIDQQVIAITSESLNITATAPNLFLHTGSGNDAIAAHSGTNVLDGGTGSNFLTAGTGADTFFVDARGAISDTWSTVKGFHSGDSATLWGVSASTPAQWLDGQGAAGNTGLTLHAGAAGGPTASITLAGFSSADLASGRVSATFGHDAGSGSDYLYVHAA